MREGLPLRAGDRSRAEAVVIATAFKSTSGGRGSAVGQSFFIMK